MWRYRNISSDFQRPISLMMSVLTCARRSAVAPAARRHCADTSHGIKPSVGPRSETAVRMQLVMAAAVTNPVEL